MLRIGRGSDNPDPHHRVKRTAGRPHNWTKIGAIAACIAVPVAIVIAIVGWIIDAQGKSSVETLPTGPLPSAPSSEGRTLPDRSCVDSSGSRVSCADDEAWLVIGTAPCTPSALRSALAVTSERNLDIETRATDSQCIVRPGPTSALAGARAFDIQLLAQGHKVPSLLVCIPSPENTGVRVACNQPHWAELVSQAKPYNSRDSVEQLCVSDARRYAQRQIGEGMEPLVTSMFTVRDHEIQCVLHLANNDILTNSVWHIAGDPLPIRR